MGQQVVQIVIEGESPLLMHRFPMVPVEAMEKKTPEDQAENTAYREPGSGELYIPGINVQRALVGGATYSKGKGRASLQKNAAACLIVSPEYLLLGQREFIIDARPVVVPATKGRIVRYRARLDKWSVTFTLEWDDTLLKATEVRRIVDDTGKRVGLLDFRPEKRGSFGRFVVARWTHD